jgi:hypothetical protein
MRYLVVMLFIPFISFAEVNFQLQKKLIEMKIEDQKVRNELNENVTKELVIKQNKVDDSNTVKLKAIIKEHSWLTKELVGVEGVGAAFLIIKHSSDITFKEKMLPYLKKSYLSDDGISGQQVALLTDDVLLTQGEKQVYGTQVKISDGKLVFRPIDDEANVDKRRAEMKMPPLASYKKMLEKVYGIKEHSEMDLD